jgi:hypothetical protein
VSSTDHTSTIASFATTSGTTYEVQVGIFNNNSCPSAGCNLHLAATNNSSPPNDQRGAAAPLTSSATGNNSFASEEPGEILACPNQGPNNNLTRPYGKTLWYRFAAPADGTAKFRSGGGVDTVAAVYAGDSPTFLACNDDDGAGTLTSLVTVPVTGGTTYFVQVGGFASASGSFAVSVDFAPAPPPNHDADGDGYVGSAFGGPDCDDANAATHPGAADVPHNGIDENCDGKDATYPVLAARATVKVAFHKTYTTITKLPVSGAPVGARVLLVCSTKKKGCGKLRSKALRVTSTKTLQLAKYVKKLKLKKNAKITVTVTTAGSIGTYTAITIRIQKPPTKKTLCLEPGATTPQKTCS